MTDMMISRPVRLSVAIGLVLCSAHAFGQSAEPTARNALEEIVVTAERRSESIQATPLSVTALSGDLLAKFDAVQFTDYAHAVPNLSFGTGNTFGITNGREITIRGIAGTNTTSYYINDTPLPISLDPRAIDLERIEVLRGPQGTLFGSSAMGGTVRLITRQPALDGSYGSADLQAYDVNQGGAGYNVSASYNLPLVTDSLALKVSGYSSYTPGVFTREWGVATTPGFILPPGQTPGRETHVGNDVEAGGSLALTFKPAGIDALTVTAMLMHQDMGSNGLALADYSPSNLVQVRPLDVPESVEDDWTFAGLTLKYAAPFGNFIESATYFYRYSRDTEDGSEVVSIGEFGPPPCTPNEYCASPSPNWVDTNQFTNEFRFESAFSGPLQLVAGVFYNKTRQQIISQEVEPYAPGSYPAFVEDIPRINEELAEFLSVDFSVTKALTVSAGVRQAHLQYSSTYVADGWINGGPSDSPATHEENATTPRFNAKYALSDTAMVYATAAKGYRVGGENSALPSICDNEGVPTGVSSYKSDSLWSYEVGAKNTWLGGLAKTRLAAYRIDWSQLQQSVLLPCTFHVTENVGAAVSKGAEFEADLAPLPGLAVNLGLGYEDAVITGSAPGAPYVVGQPLNGVPRWTGSVLGDYSVPMAAGTGFVRAQYSYTGSSVSFNNPPNPCCTVGRYRSSYSLVNVFVGERWGEWEASVFAKNLLDVRANLGDEQSEISELPGRPRWLIATPRTVGLELKRRF